MHASAKKTLVFFQGWIMNMILCVICISDFAAILDL
jgi:hypothetical protein